MVDILAASLAFGGTTVGLKGRRQRRRLMRALGKPALAVRQIAKGAPPNHLGLQGAMKPLVLALGLRMIGLAMADGDTQLGS
jgi:hypothetical protein